MNQRWREGVHSFRTDHIDPSRYDVSPIPGDGVATGLCHSHHYSRSYPAARRRFGLYDRGDLVGVAVYSQPCSQGVLSRYFDPARSVELGRFVLLDEVPGNGESWFLARTFELAAGPGLRGRCELLRSGAQDDRRRPSCLPRPLGLHLPELQRGEVGTLHGPAAPPPAGRPGPQRPGHLQDPGPGAGLGYAAQILVDHGAEPLAGDPAAWLRLWLARITRTLAHPGNHRYVFGLDRRTKRNPPALGAVSEGPGSLKGDTVGIPIDSEKLISFAEAADRLPSSRTGKRVHRLNSLALGKVRLQSM